MLFQQTGAEWRAADYYVRRKRSERLGQQQGSTEYEYQVSRDENVQRECLLCRITWMGRAIVRDSGPDSGGPVQSLASRESSRS